MNSFIASISPITCPAETWSPTATYGVAPGDGDEPGHERQVEDVADVPPAVGVRAAHERVAGHADADLRPLAGGAGRGRAGGPRGGQAHVRAPPRP
ncbi:MAG: hypothetical protein ACJ77N_15660, partial [Chloroflexota bacterium]